MVGWLLMIAFASSVVSIAVESPEHCQALAQLNREHWRATGQPAAIMACAKTIAI